MEFSKKENILCFPKEELLKIFETSKKKELMQEIAKNGFSFNDLQKDYSKMEKISDVVGERGAQDRDEHEIFAALFLLLRFYKKTSQVCFELKGFNPTTDRINSLDDLYRFRKGDSISDFIIKSEDGSRHFQLKRYREEINISELFNFIKKVVTHYGNNLGSTNLLIIFQSKSPIFNLDFQKLHEKVKSLRLNFEGEILISYNENNKQDVMTRIYPELAQTQIPIFIP